MSKQLKKVFSVATSVTTIVWLSGVAALAPMAAGAVTINEGDTIKTASNPDVYIVKYVGAKKFKRLILSPSVFVSYKHLSWSKIKTVSQAEMDSFTDSQLVRAVGDPKVYKLTPVANSDNGSKQWVNMTADEFVAKGYDWDSIYQINTVDRDSYTSAGDITSTYTPPVNTGVAGSLTVALASDTPAAGVAPVNAARVPFTKVALTAGASDVTITALTAQRTGLASDSALSSVALIDAATNLQVGLNQTLNSIHQVTFRSTITIPANTTKYFYLSANMPSSLTSYAGQVAALSLVGVETTATVNGALPISGNGQTINATLAIGTVAASTGSLNVSTSTKEVGVTNFTFSSVKLTAGSAEDVTVYSIRFNQSGSASASDLANVVVSDGSTNYATTVSSDGKYYTASFGTAGITIAKGLSKEFTVKADILSGSNRTISFDIYRTTDFVVKGTTYGYYLTLDSNTTYPWNTASNPVFNGNDITVGTGSLRVDKSSTGAPAANVTKGASDVILGAFDFVVQGEAVNVTNMVFAIDMTGTTASSSDITNITLSKADGVIIAGPVDGADTSSSNPDGTATFAGTVTFPVGTTKVIVKGKVSTDPANNAQIQLSLNTPATKVTGITGATTGNTITATPASQVSANIMTIKAGTLVVSVSGTPVAQTVIKGATGYTFANYIFDASASGEDIRVTTIAIQDTEGAGASGAELTTMQLWDGATALNTGSNVLSPSNGSTGANSYTVTLDNALIVPKGTQKTIALKGNISGSASAGSTNTHAWGLASGAAVSATGVSTGLDIAESINDAAGSAMTISSAGQYSVALDSSTPTGKLIAANTTGNIMTVLKFYATSEEIKVNKIRLALSNASSSCNDLSQVYIYDGSTLLGQGVLGVGNAVGTTANASSTFTLSTPLTIPANTTKVVTIKADIAPIYTANTVATAGHMIAIDYYGSTDTTENVGVGQASGTEIANYSATTAQTVAYIMKSVPTVSKLTLPTSTLSNGSVVLYKFRVAADAKGDIDLNRVTFQVATTTATATAFELYDITATPERQINNDITATANSTDMAMPFEYPDSTQRAVTIAAGTYRDFELRATLAGVTTGSSITVSLQGDAADPAALNNGLITGTLVNADANNDFVWSDWSSSAHSSTAVTSADFFNGFLVSGLPSSNLTAETLSK